uniref:Gamma-secretase subunit PEN-2 n=1 Tax=Knipowitschia caucasica TaxID=637954 RepID=A0AAV2MDE9_KNICA
MITRAALSSSGNSKHSGTSTMNLERVPNEEKLNLCRKYYLGGFALLPFLWLVNVIWFFREAFLKPSYSEQTQIKTYVKRSALGVLLWAVVLSVWITVFQHFRAEWGEVGDYLSFTIPLGTP